MKKWLNIFLLAEALLCILICIVGEVSSNVLGDIVSVPFEQLGGVLRILSLSGALGNIVAWCLYIGICTTPIIIGIIKLIKRRFKMEDGLLFVLGGVLYVVMYYTINTSEFRGPEGILMDKEISVAVLGAAAYSVIIGYIMLVAVRKVRSSNTCSLRTYLNVILLVVNVILVYATFGSGLRGVLDSLANLVETNVGFEQELLTSKIFVWIGYMIDVVINVMLIGTIIAIQQFIEKFDMDNISEMTVARAGKISKFCAVTVVINVLLHITYNVLQIILVSELHVIKSTVSIPIIMVVAMLVFMVMAQFILDAKKIKDENDMFI